jgi:hypothetical protein
MSRLTFTLIPGRLRTRCWNVHRVRDRAWLGCVEASRFGGRLIFLTPQGAERMNLPTARDMQDIAAFMAKAPTTAQLVREAAGR